MLQKNKLNGLTLIETLLAVSVGSIVSIGFINKQIEQNKKDQALNFLKEASNVVKAVDHRIAIDGYDPSLWNKTSWSNELEIVNELIKKDLTSKHLTNCSGGDWNPTTNAEDNTKLIQCNQWQTRKDNGIEMSAMLTNDSAGFINNFTLILSFKTQKAFEDNFVNLKYALKNIKTHENQELSGIHTYDLISNTTKNDITSFECVSNTLDCAIKLSLERSGGNEYIRADGQNSMIGERLTFIESKGQSPMKCIRWKNTARNGSGIWTKETDELCGIGVYKNTPYPVMVDVVADTGTFKNVVLDQDCKVFGWNGSNVIDTGTTSPCGVLNNSTSSEIIQVVQNIQSEKAEIKDFYANTANIANIYIKNIVSESIIGNYVYVENELMTDIIKSNKNTKIEIHSEMRLKELLQLEEDFYAAKNIYITGNSSIQGNNIIGGNNLVDGNIEALGYVSSNGNIYSNSSIISNEELKLNKVNAEGSNCSTNGSLSRTTNGTLLSCVSGVWESAIKDTMPIGSIVLWGSSSIPNGWLELNGQSTASYPTLRALVGNNVPDMRGVFARGWDHGRGVDSGRSLKSYQSDDLAHHFHGLGKFGSSGNDDGFFIDGDWSDGNNYSVRWVAGEGNRVVRSTSNGNLSYSIRSAYDDQRTYGETRPKNIAFMYIIKAK